MQKVHPTAVTASERAAAATPVVEASVWCTKCKRTARIDGSLSVTAAW